MNASAYSAILAAIGALLTTWFQTVGKLEVSTFLIMFGGFMVLLSASLGAAGQNFRPAQSLFSGFALVLLGFGFHWWDQHTRVLDQQAMVADAMTKQVISDIEAAVDYDRFYTNAALSIVGDNKQDAQNILVSARAAKTN